jgi:hypothetical protein
MLHHRSFGLVAHVLRCAVWTLDSRDGITYRALQFKERCDLFWETETQIGSDVPSPVITDGDQEGSVYPIDGRLDHVCESRGAK